MLVHQRVYKVGPPAMIAKLVHITHYGSWYANNYSIHGVNLN